MGALATDEEIVKVFLTEKPSIIKYVPIKFRQNKEIFILVCSKDYSLANYFPNFFLKDKNLIF